jgi:hypothetical protein
MSVWQYPISLDLIDEYAVKRVSISIFLILDEVIKSFEKFSRSLSSHYNQIKILKHLDFFTRPCFNKSIFNCQLVIN